jgi:hypothetical protein
MRVIFSPRDSAPQRPLREIVSALSAIFASDDKVIYVSLIYFVNQTANRRTPIQSAITNRKSPTNRQSPITDPQIRAR